LNYSRPDTYQINVAPDVLVPMRDGFVLTCDLYRPAQSNGTLAPGKFPGLVINYEGYGRTFIPFGNDVRGFAAKGYNLIWCNTRGSQGLGGASPAPHSVGLVTPWQPQEQIDNYDLIEWFAAQSWSTGRIGQIGISYGGISTWLVAGRQQPPSLKAIIPIEGATNMYRQFVYPGGIRTVGDARGGWAQGCGFLTGEPTCSERIPQEWAAHPTYDSFWREQAIDPSKIKAAVLNVEGQQDIFIDEVDAVTPVLNARDDWSLLFGPWVHGAPESQAINPIGTGIYLAWFDRWLQGYRVPRFPKVIAYEMPLAGPGNAQYRAFAAWPPERAKAERLHLKADGTLDRTPTPGHASSNSYAVPGDGTSGQVVYTTEPFRHAAVVAGPVDVTLTAAFTAMDGNIIADLHDVSPDGSDAQMGPAGYLKASHRTSDSNPTPVTPGQSYVLKIRIPSKFWNIAEGHRLRLKITSVDTIVAADAPAGTVTVSTGTHRPSYVDLSFLKAAR
jgi:predicted acyl esterase